MVSVPSLKDLWRRLRAGPWGRIAAEPGIAEHVQQAVKLVTENKRFKGAIRFLEGAGLDIKKMIKSLEGELTFALIDPQRRERSYNVVIAVGSSQPDEALERIVRQISALAAFANGMATQANYMGVPVTRISFEQGRRNVFLAVTRGRLIAATRRETLGHIIKGLAGGDVATLGRQDWFIKLKKQLGRPIDLLTHTTLPSDDKLTRLSENARQIINALRAVNFEGTDYMLSFGRQAVREISLVRLARDEFAVDNAGDIRSVLRPIDPAIWSELPGGTFACLATRISLPDLVAFIDTILTALQVQEPNALRAKLEGGAVWGGLKLDDLTAAWDGHLTVSVSLPTVNTIPVTLVPDFLVSLRVKDTYAADRVVKALQKILGTTVWFEAAPFTYGGHKGFRLKLRQDQRERISPTVARIGRRIIASLWTEPVKRQMAGGDTGRDLTRSADFQATRRAVGPADALLLSYTDTRALLPFVYNTLIFGAHVGMREPPVDLTALPDGSRLARHLSGTGMALRSTDRGLEWIVHSPTGLAPSFGVAGLSAAYLRQAARVTRREQRLRLIADRMKALYTSLVSFEAKNGRGPSALSELYPDFVRSFVAFTFERNWPGSDPRNLLAARQRINRSSPYLYLKAELGKAARPLLTVKPSQYHNRDLCPVFFGDGRTQDMTREQLVELLDRSGYDRRGRPTDAQQDDPDWLFDDGDDLF